MATKPKKSGYVASPLFNRIREILESAHASVTRTINTTQVLVNWLIGREIVEEEQRARNALTMAARCWLICLAV